MHILKKIRLLVVVALTLGHQTAFALDAHPGDAVAPPPGHGLVGVYYIQQDLDSFKKNSKQVGNNQLSTQIGLLRGLYATKVGHVQVNPQMVIPFGKVEGKGGLGSVGSKTGIGDVSVLASIMLKQDPKTNTSVYVMPGVKFKTGAYDKTKTSIGGNRNEYYLQAGAQKGLNDKWLVDGYADVTWYGANKDHAAGKLEQDPTINLQSFVRYKASPTTELSAGLRHTSGGETSINKVKQDDQLNKTSALVGVSHWYDKTTQVMVNWGKDLEVNHGFENANNLELRFVKVF